MRFSTYGSNGKLTKRLESGVILKKLSSLWVSVARNIGTLRRKKTDTSHLDFEHRCCFRDQIVNIGRGTRDGDGEEVEVDMQSGRVAIFELTAKRFDFFSFGDTGQRDWYYKFIRYKE